MYDSDTRQTTPPADGAAPRPAVLTWLFFPAALLYHELLLRAFDSQSLFFDPALVLVVLFALSAGLFWSFLLHLFRRRGLATALSLTVITLWTVLLCVEYCCRSYFRSYFFLSFIAGMTDHVITGFGSAIPEVVLPRLPFILLSFLPLVLCIVLRCRIIQIHQWLIIDLSR